MKEKNKDWHKADIRAALEKKGTNFRKLSLEHGLAGNTVRNAIDRKWPKGEQIIANAIGIAPQEIWPSRYCNGQEKLETLLGSF